MDVWPERLPPSPGELRQRAAGASALLTLLTDRVDAELLDSAPELKVVSNLAVGCDNIDVAAAGQRGIPVGYTPGVLAETTADLAFALILAIARRLPEGATAVRDGDWLTWEPGWLLGRDVHGATLGIVGLGSIGREVAKRAAGFDMTVISATRAQKVPGTVCASVPLEELLERGGLRVASLPSERRDARADRRGRARADEAHGVPRQHRARADRRPGRASRRRCTSGTIAGAALDVTDPEPLPPDDPLLSAPNLLVLPHLGSATHATRKRMAELAVDNVLAGLEERPLPNEYNLRVDTCSRPHRAAPGRGPGARGLPQAAGLRTPRSRSATTRTTTTPTTPRPSPPRPSSTAMAPSA